MTTISNILDTQNLVMSFVLFIESFKNTQCFPKFWKNAPNFENFHLALDTQKLVVNLSLFFPILKKWLSVCFLESWVGHFIGFLCTTCGGGVFWENAQKFQIYRVGFKVTFSRFVEHTKFGFKFFFKIKHRNVAHGFSKALENA